MSLLKNAKNSIRLGLEDYKSKDKRRVISSVRNFHSGVLLLLKEKLRRLSPPNSEEVLVKEKIMPQLDANGNLVFVGKGKKTVDIQQMQDRFNSLGIKFDWPRFKKITDLRNDMEHYHASTGPDVVNEMVSDAFILVRDFVKNELAEDARAFLGRDGWKTFVTEGGVYRKERQDCLVELEKVKWESNTLRDAIVQFARCPQCRALLLKPRDASLHYSKLLLECRSCGKTHEFHSIAAQALEKINDSKELIEECSSCSQDGYVVSEGRCVFCGEQTDCECSECGCEFPYNELNENRLCADCQRDYRT